MMKDDVFFLAEEAKNNSLWHRQRIDYAFAKETIKMLKELIKASTYKGKFQIKVPDYYRLTRLEAQQVKNYFLERGYKIRRWFGTWKVSWRVR